MADDDSPRLRVPHPGWLALATAILAAIGVGLALWLYGGTTAKVRGHGWFVYPAAAEARADGVGGDGGRAEGWPENVALLSLEHREQVSRRGETHERLLEALCHVLIVLPEGTPHATAGGGGSDGGVVYERMEWSSAVGDQMRQQGVEVRFRLADRYLWAEGQTTESPLDASDPRPSAVDRDTRGPFSTASGNVFLVRLGSGHSVTDVAPLGESVTGRIDAARLERLLEKGAKSESR